MAHPTLLRRGSSGAKLREVFVWKGIFLKLDTVELIRLLLLLFWLLLLLLLLLLF